MFKPCIPCGADVGALSYFFPAQPRCSPAGHRKTERRRIQFRAPILQVGPKLITIYSRHTYPISYYTSITTLLYDPVKQGLVRYAIILAREKGVSPYVGDGLNRWPAAHVQDTAPLYRLALEKNDIRAKYHAVAEEGVRLRDIAEVIGKGLKVPVVSMSEEEAPAHFGWLAMFVGRDAPVSSALTQKRLGWQPTGPGLIADLEQMNYFAS